MIIGGGIYGACLAWEAVLRSLSVALLEKNDFCSGTSANSLKTIHGGLRYLQNADFKRLYISSRERTALLRIAPHLVHVLPVIVPTYGFGRQSKLLLLLALHVNDAFTNDRTHLIDPEKCVPTGEIISKSRCLEYLPGIDKRELTGGALFYDAQVYNSERLALAFLRSAAKAGADIANYAEVTNLISRNGVVCGVAARDRLSGTAFEVRAKIVVDASGPWLRAKTENARLAKAVNVVTRPIFEKYAVGLSTPHELGKNRRLYFVSPWRDHSIVGTEYQEFTGKPDQFRVCEKDVQALLDGFNQAYPAGKLTRDDVTFAHGGLLPISNENRNGVKLASKHSILDQRHHNMPGLIQVEGVKYTTARYVAEKTIDRVFEIWNKTSRSSVSAVTPIQGGEIESFSRFIETETHNQAGRLNEGTLCKLIYNYGTAYPGVLEQLEPTSGYLDDSDVLDAEVLYGVRKEMAQKLSDVVFRRTELGTAGCPSADRLRRCADVMGAELGWDESRQQQEIDNVNAVYDWTSI